MSKSKVSFEPDKNLIKEVKSKAFRMLAMAPNSPDGKWIDRIGNLLEQQQTQIDKLEKDARNLKSELISIAAWVACETQGDDYTENMQTRLHNNVVKKLKALSRTKQG